MDNDVLVQATQFGIAGLIAWMWMTERRAALGRERQLTEAHERLMEQRTQLEALVRLVAENTRALASIETGLGALPDAVLQLLGDRKNLRIHSGSVGVGVVAAMPMSDTTKTICR